MLILNSCNSKRPLPCFTLTPSKRLRFALTFTTMPRRNNKKNNNNNNNNNSTQSVSFPSKTAVSRISRYPDPKPPLQREVHAPCRPSKFHVSSNSTRECQSVDIATNCSSKTLETNHQKVRNAALASDCFLKSNDVVEVDDVSLKDRAVSEEVSSMQEIHIVQNDNDDDETEGHSVVAHQKSRNTDDDVVVNEIHDDFDSKVTDGGLRKCSTSLVASGLMTDNDNNNLNVVDAGTMLSSLSLSPEHGFLSIRAYKKLIKAIANQSRRDTFERLSYEIKLNEKRREAFDLLRPKKASMEEQEEAREPFVPLTKEEKAEVACAFSAKRNEVLVTHEKSNIAISVNKFHCLKPKTWLNDEVINLYLELLKEREIREPQKFLKCHFFNTFFYKKLISGTNGYDFKSVRRWTNEKKLGYGLHECDKIFVPIHREVHWCLAVINKKDRKFQYLDSLKGMDTRVLKVLAKYFVDEVKDKTGEDIDISSWDKEFVEDLPEQKNGYDCGVFMIKYIDFFSRNLGLCFNQNHMPYFRLRTAKEILRLKAD